MRSALAAFVSAGYALSAVWDEAVVDHEVYGSVFQHDFDESLCRLERLVPEPLDIDGLEGPHDEERLVGAVLFLAALGAAQQEAIEAIAACVVGYDGADRTYQGAVENARLFLAEFDVDQPPTTNHFLPRELAQMARMTRERRHGS